MNTLGEKLKKARELKGLTLDEMASSTRIQKKFLQFLEDENFAALPAAVFVTGFLRAYAAQVGMDPNGVVAEYDAIRAAANPQPELTRRKAEEKKTAVGVYMAIGVVVLVVAVAVAYPLMFPKHHKKEVKTDTAVIDEDLITPKQPTPSQQADVAPQPGEPAVAGQPNAVAQSSTPAPTGETAKTSDPKSPVAFQKTEQQKTADGVKPEKGATQPSPQGYAYTVGLSATKEDVWIYAVIDDSEVRDMYIRAGKTVFIHGNKNFMLTTGNAFYLQVKVNGKPVRIPGSTTNKVIRNWPVPLE
ncbi:MAG: DUF4115 domain-containing protein [Nitrospinae bacterium]|nr:DUF4115 domain-containing protein [Nitrospinota bacterium]